MDINVYKFNDKNNYRYNNSNNNISNDITLKQYHLRPPNSNTIDRNAMQIYYITDLKYVFCILCLLARNYKTQKKSSV